MTPFELSWRGGATAARLAARRPGGDELPWGTIDLARYSDADAIAAREVWTNGVFTEYASAAAFSSLTTAMLACAAPVDLVAASADIVVDELAHVALSSRLCAELGGSVAIDFDVADIAPRTTPGVRPLVAAAELALTTSCIGEALSVPALARSRVMVGEPLVRAVLDRLLADEGQHARLGLWFFAWAAERLTRSERDALAAIAEAALAAYASLWRDDPHDPLRVTVERGIVAPLARLGIAIDASAVLYSR